MSFFWTIFFYSTSSILYKNYNYNIPTIAITVIDTTNASALWVSSTATQVVITADNTIGLLGIEQIMLVLPSTDSR